MGRYETLAKRIATAYKLQICDEGVGVEIWTRGSGWCLDDDVHTAIPQREDYPTESELWKYIYGQVKNIRRCAPDCTCKQD